MRREGPANPYSGSSVWFRGLMTSVAEPRLELETFIVRARALRHVRDTFVRNTPPTTKRVRFSVVSQPRGTHSYQSHPRSQTLSRKATNDRFCVLLEEDEAPVTHFGPGCNGGISIGIVLRHGRHGTLTRFKHFPPQSLITRSPFVIRWLRQENLGWHRLHLQWYTHCLFLTQLVS